MEEIEELRAKAIASMPTSVEANESAISAVVAGEGGGSQFKCPTSREEGEVSSSEDADFATTSVAPTNMANLDESIPYTLRNNPIKEVKSTPAAHLSTAGMQFRPSSLQNQQKHYHKHFKRKLLPFRSLGSQALHWHAKESKNNLVISFSDDSGSESEECSPEKDVKRRNNTSNACNSRSAVTSLPKLTDGIEREPSGIKLTSKKSFTNHATVSSHHNAYVTSSRPQETSTNNDPYLHKKMPTIKVSSSRELVHGQDSAMADQRLQLLRSQITAQENQLKVQSKSVLQKESLVDSDSHEGLHAMKREAHATRLRRHSRGSTLEFEANEPSRKRLKHDKSSVLLSFDASCDPENGTTFRAKSYTDNNVKSCVLKSKDSLSVPSAVNVRDGFLSENDDFERYTRSKFFPKIVEARKIPPKYVRSMHAIKGKHQPISTTDVSSPMETFSVYEKLSDLGSRNKEIYASQPDMAEEGSIPFHTLVNLEEILDKELEKAQEHRCKCELEERHALIAYRKAQRALVEANARCSSLYGNREIFSAKFRAFLMEASTSICPSNWLCRQITHEDQFYEPDANTSVHRDNGTLDEAVPPTHNPNMLTDDDGEDFNKVVESGSAHVDVQTEKKRALDNSQDYELLEASLRSKLVARLGLRESSKVNDTSKKKFDDEKMGGEVTEYMEPSPLPPQKVVPSAETKQTAKLDGIERTKESSCLLSAPLDSQLLVNISSNEELQRIADVDTNNFFHKDSNNRTFTASFSLPSSRLHTVCRHADIIFPGCRAEAFNMKENDYFMTEKEMKLQHFVPDIGIVEEVLNFMGYAPTGYKDVYKSSVKIDPFWPLCMFEFRGKCNDEECPWQHMKSGVSPNLTNNEHSDVRNICLPNGSSDAPKYSFSVHVLPIPTYQIGQYLIKADHDHSQSVLSQSNWQYQQRGFCASFSTPFSVRRILPLDAPCLQTADDPVADYHGSNRLFFLYQSREATLLFKEQVKQGSCDMEQIIEMALDQFDGEFCESARTKALSLLAHAIEWYPPPSVLLWVVYLHIYYRKEKDIGKDDMFLHAVRQNKCSYELWLLYINSRMLCEDRLNAYDRALDVLCHIGGHDNRKPFSSYILDIFLQMLNFLSMCEHVDKAIIRICEVLPCNDFKKSGDNPLPGICTCLTVSDRCLFWVSCIYFIVYEILPESIVQQFEFVKNLSFQLDWPSVEVTLDRKELALKLMKLAMNEMSSHLDDNPKEMNQVSLQSLHFLAVNHVKCTATLRGSRGYIELLERYLKLFPSCMELVLMYIRLKENYASDLNVFAFEEALYHWPKETLGIQCLWHQYVEYALSNHRMDLVEKLMDRWYHDFQKFRGTPTNENSLHPSSNMNSTSGIKPMANDDAFGFLNLSLYWMLHENIIDASHAIDKSLELAAPEDYIHFVKEHALFMASQKYLPGGSLTSLVNRYLSDPRSNLQLEPLSRNFIQTIKKPRIQQMVKNIMGPISTGSTLVNSVMEAFYGSSLLPETFDDIKAATGFIESLMEMIPTNYKLALSVYKTCCRNFAPSHSGYKSLKFWACCLLINSIFQASPVAPEHIWLETASFLSSSESIEVTVRFHKQAISVYPFSVKIWQSYANLYSASTSDASEIFEAAQERGIELNTILDQL